MPKGLKAGGRTAGTPNRTTKQIRTSIADIISGELDRLQETFDSLPPQQRLYYLVKLLPFIIPKPVAVMRSDLEPGGNDEEQMPIHITMDLGNGNVKSYENAALAKLLGDLE